MQWIYGSGFPKSMDISKVIDKRGAEREIVCEIYQTRRSLLRCNRKHEGNIFQCGSNDKNITAPTTPEANNGKVGNLLKPANEPIVVAVKTYYPKRL